MDQNTRGSNGSGGETPEFKALLTKSMEELRAKTMGHQVGWGLGKANRWSLDMSQGDLIFTFDKIVAKCPAQIVGSLDTTDGSWLWGWATAKDRAPDFGGVAWHRGRRVVDGRSGLQPVWSARRISWPGRECFRVYHFWGSRVE